MNKYRCLGCIKNVTSNDLHNEITNILPNVKGRPRLFGYDIEFESDDFSLYINTYDEKEYQLDISMENKDNLFYLLDLLKKALLKLNTIFDLVYFIENENDEQISDDCIYFNNRLIF